MPWGRLALDAAIFVVGFGAFFWFLVIRPAAGGAEIDFLKQALSQATSRSTASCCSPSACCC